jgi:hypothetical protein
MKPRLLTPKSSRATSKREYWSEEYAPAQRRIGTPMKEIIGLQRMVAENGERMRKKENPDHPWLLPHKTVSPKDWGDGPITESDFASLLLKIDSIWDPSLDTRGYSDSWNRFCQSGPEIACRLGQSPAGDARRIRLTTYFAHETIENKTDWGYLDRTARHIMASLNIPSFRTGKIEEGDYIEENPHEATLDPYSYERAKKRAVPLLAEGFGLIFDTMQTEEAFEAVTGDLTGCIRDSVMHAYLEEMLEILLTLGDSTLIGASDPYAFQFDAATAKLPEGVYRYVDLLEPLDLCSSSPDRYGGSLFSGNNRYWIEHSYGAYRYRSEVLMNAYRKAESIREQENRKKEEDAAAKAQAAASTKEAQEAALKRALEKEKRLRAS